MQIGEKLRNQDAFTKGKLKFNNLYYARLLAQNPEENLDFFLKESIQKIIDSQYTKTKAILSTLFMVYLICYVLPFIVILFTEHDHGSGVTHSIHNTCARLCLVTQILFFGIELI